LVSNLDTIKFLLNIPDINLFQKDSIDKYTVFDFVKASNDIYLIDLFDSIRINEIDKLLNENEQLKDQNLMHNQNNELKMKLNDFTDEIKSKEETIQDLTQSLFFLNLENDVLKNKIYELENSNQKLKESEMKLKEELDKIINLLNDEIEKNFNFQIILNQRNESIKFANINENEDI
jgi:septal ring factor EnvC (AmiA/AmiB activator)